MGADESKSLDGASYETELRMAALYGNFEKVRDLVDGGVDVNATNNDGMAPLHWAVQKRLDIVRYLVEHGANVNSTSINGLTPLHNAVEKGHLDIVAFLVEHGAYVNAARSDGWTPLHMAANVKKFDIVKYLVEHGANVNSTDKDDITPFFYVAEGGGLDLVKCLVTKHCANMNAKTKYGYTILHKLAEKGRLDIVQYFVDNGVNMNSADGGGKTPLHQAVWEDHFDVASYFVMHGANVNAIDKNGRTPLHAAAEKGHFDIVKCLVDHGADLNMRNYEAETAFDVAKEKGFFSIMMYLFEHGAKIKRPSESGGTSLHRMGARHMETVEYLVKNYAYMNATDKLDRSPLFFAVGEGYLDFVKCLVEHGANVNHADNNDDTPLHLAVRGCNLDIVKCLVEHGANVNATNKDRNAPLHEATEKGILEIVKCLVNHGADLNMKNKYGKTPLEIARAAGKQDIVQLLSDSLDSNSVQLRALIHEFENLPRERKAEGRFIVDDNIWIINRELAIINLREVIRLFRRYPKLIDWSGKYNGIFTFGGRLSNDDPNYRSATACATTDAKCIELGSYYFSLSLDEFRRICQDNQKEDEDEDGVKRCWHVRAVEWELKTVRHEFGHVFQFLFRYAMAEKNPQWKDEKEYCRKFKEMIIVDARKYGWNEAAPPMSGYGLTKDWEWFAECFANAQNAFAQKPFEKDPNVSAEENERQRIMLNEARLIGSFCWHKANDFSDDASSI